MVINKLNSFFLTILLSIAVPFLIASNVRAEQVDLNVEDGFFTQIDYDNSAVVEAELKDLQEETDSEKDIEEELKEEEAMFPIQSSRNFNEEKPKAPEIFQDSEIKRTLKDGSVQSFDGDEYMIVRRGAKKKPAPTPELKVIRERVEVVKTIVKIKQESKNRITLYGGYGPNDLEVNENVTKIKLDKDGVVGLGYSRKITNKVNLDIIGLSNETFMGGIGLSF